MDRSIIQGLLNLIAANYPSGGCQACGVLLTHVSLHEARKLALGTVHYHHLDSSL